MRITQSVVRELAGEAAKVTGRPVLEGIISPGDGRTHYIMTESAVSTYYGARAATAYLLGILCGSDPAGPAHWIAARPGRITEIDTAYRFGSISGPCLRAFDDGCRRGRELLVARKGHSDPRGQIPPHGCGTHHAGECSSEFPYNQQER
jgi:hypothetical protein